MSRGPEGGILVALWIGVAFVLGVALLLIGVAGQAGRLPGATVSFLVQLWYGVFGAAVLVLGLVTWRSLGGPDGRG